MGMLVFLIASILSPGPAVRDLGADSFPARQRAVREVRQAGVRAVPALTLASACGDLHTRRTAARLLDRYRVEWVRLRGAVLGRVLLSLDANDVPHWLAHLPITDQYIVYRWCITNCLTDPDIEFEDKTDGCDCCTPWWAQSARERASGYLLPLP